MTNSNSRSLKRKRQKRNRLIGMIIIVLILAAGGYYYTQVIAKEQVVTEEPTLQTAKVRTGDIVVSIDGIGEILPLDDVSVGFQFNGIIMDILVSVGDKVQEGQILAKLDDTNARLQLEQAELNWLAMTSPQAIAEAELEVYLAQDKVSLAQEELKYLISPSVYHWELEVSRLEKLLSDYKNDDQISEQTLQETEKELSSAQSNLAQAQYLYKTVYLPENFSYTFIDSETGLEAVDAVTGELLLTLVAPTTNEILLARAVLRDSELALQEAQLYLSILKGEIDEDGYERTISGTSITQYEQAKLAIDSAQLNLDNTILKSPINGTVTSINARIGQSSGTNPIIDIKSIDQMYLSFYMEESALPYISSGKRLIALFDAYPDLEINGEVINIDPSLTIKDGELVIHGWGALDVPDSVHLLSLMSADVQIIAAESYDTLLVPIQAVRELAPGSYSVFVVNEDQSLEMRIVTIGAKDFANVEILSGLTKGETISTGTVETVQ
jgi:HlyD family secretion protein